jgi:hypothetical protein
MADDDDELELTRYQKKIAELIKATPRPGQAAARSAIIHVQKAWKLRSSDPEMAAFRVITGMEEASTAVFHALRRRGYARASVLDRYKHVHKWGLTAFFEAVAKMFHELDPPLEPHCEVRERDGVECVLFRFKVPGRDQVGYPIPPLNIVMTGADGKPVNFQRQLSAVASARKFKDIRKYVDDLANFRNTILYANEQGVPKAEGGTTRFILRNRDNIFRTLSVFLMIDPYPQKQPFVQHCLDAFLPIITKLKPDPAKADPLTGPPPDPLDK